MKLLLLAAISTFSVAAYAEPTYLKCDLLSFPDYQRFSSQHQQDAFIAAAIDRGVLGSVVEPSDTWIVDLEKGQVRVPDGGDLYTVSNLQVTDGKIIGTTRSGAVFDLNRISLKLSYTKFLDGKRVEIQGITLPGSSTWSFQCAASKTPAV